MSHLPETGTSSSFPGIVSQEETEVCVAVMTELNIIVRLVGIRHHLLRSVANRLPYLQHDAADVV